MTAAAGGMGDGTAGAPFAGWDMASFEAAGMRRDVYRKGTGPGVVLMPEVPGFDPRGIALAERLVGAGFRVAAASLFGDPGRERTPGYALATAARLCVMREFAAFAGRGDRPVAEFVRALARDLHGETGGAGVGVIGMCFTGSFALAAAADPAVLAPVASQPGIPPQQRSTTMSDREAAAVRDRVERDGLCALGLRFTEDVMVRPARFRVLAELFGDGWRVVEIDSSPGNPHGISRFAHSVLTDPDAVTPGHPTHAANEELVAFLRERLAAPTARPTL